MAITDARSGFRLPWSSDRSHESPTEESTEAADAVQEPVPDPIAWPSTDLNSSLGLNSQQRPVNLSDVATPPDAQEPEMINTEPAPPPAPVAHRKPPAKLMADLSAAIRATAEAARDQAMAQVDADVAAVVEQIRVGSKSGEETLRVRTDEDIAGIKDWSRAEIARIKEETEQRISARKITLDEELAAHAAAIEQRVGQVESTAASYRAEMDAYSSSLSREDDPALLATMAESIPEAPALDAFGDLAGLELDLSVATLAQTAVEEEAEAPVEPEAVLETVEPAVEIEPEATPEAVVEPVEPVADAPEEPEAVLETVEPAAEIEPEAVVETIEADAVVEPEPETDRAPAWNEATSAWGEPETPWAGIAATAVADDEAVTELDDDGSGAYTLIDDVPRWAAGETPDGFPTGEAESGDPVNRGAIMAAIEAAAEAVVAAESAAESADQAEAAADVAETAAELLKGRVDADEEYDPEANAALSARVDAGGFEESYADRLASLLPNHGEGSADGEPRTTQVIVSGLVSVASIASFKRHLGRLGGVQAVAVASGPDGEFVFNVTHRPDVSFRDAVPTMPGFAARVTGTADGVVHVTARDPESEG